jgi:DsbC/DsbD-like thiol-disulfide interchange protein
MRTRRPLPNVRFLGLLLALSAGLSLPGLSPAAAVVGSWAKGDHVTARLVIAGQETSAPGTIAAAVEIRLPQGWKTYWRTPGSGGIPPRFDFSASRNLADAEIAYPYPQRFDDGYSIANVYEGRVVFPVTLKADDPDQPVRVDLTVDLGVCEKVCIPAMVRVKAESARANDVKASAIVAAARALVPGAPLPGLLAGISLKRVGGSDEKPEFELRANAGADAVVFLEGPDDWFASAPRLLRREGDVAVFGFSFDRVGSRVPIGGTAIHVTLVGGGRAVEQPLAIDETGRIP